VARTTGTEHEGVGLPVLYHHYIGHDNNRDAFMQNTVESRYGAQILFREWIPQAYVDHHQMGGFTARIYLPPYAEPIRPEGDPLVWREMAWYGAHMAYKMDEEGLEGAVNAAIYSGWGHFGFHWISNSADRASSRNTKRRPRSRVRGRAGGGVFATSWTGRRWRTWRRSTLRLAIVRQCCATRT
jgi:hypothetical protein